MNMGPDITLYHSQPTQPPPILAVRMNSMKDKGLCTVIPNYAQLGQLRETSTIRLIIDGSFPYYTLRILSTFLAVCGRNTVLEIDNLTGHCRYPPTVEIMTHHCTEERL